VSRSNAGFAGEPHKAALHGKRTRFTRLSFTKHTSAFPGSGYRARASGKTNALAIRPRSIFLRLDKPNVFHVFLMTNQFTKQVFAASRRNKVQSMQK
jgi:hypothetical protein